MSGMISSRHIPHSLLAFGPLARQTPARPPTTTPVPMCRRHLGWRLGRIWPGTDCRLVPRRGQPTVVIVSVKKWEPKAKR